MTSQYYALLCHNTQVSVYDTLEERSDVLA